MGWNLAFTKLGFNVSKFQTFQTGQPESSEALQSQNPGRNEYPIETVNRAALALLYS
jgi:hypothetical protein